jgi:hypothetical protein
MTNVNFVHWFLLAECAEGTSLGAAEHDLTALIKSPVRSDYSLRLPSSFEADPL